MGVKSIQEEISELEQEFNSAKGPGSLKKKQALKAKIEELKKASEPAEGEDVPEKTLNLPAGVNEEDIPVITKPFATKTVENVTLEQILAYEKEGKLVGFDKFKKTALIRA